MLQGRPSALGTRALLERGLAHQRRGELENAVAVYTDILRTDPNHFDALHMLGVAALQAERYEAAIQWITHAIRQNPRVAAAHNNLALACMKAGRTEDAAESYRHVLALRPDAMDTHAQYTMALTKLGRLDEALASCAEWVARYPGAAAPRLSQAVVLRCLECPEEALASCEAATALEPTLAEAWDKRGAALRDLGRLPEALASFERAIELQPDFAMAHTNLAMTLLLLGHFERGWPSYEWRLHPDGPVGARRWDRPRWRGHEPVEGKTLLLWSEQGLGDTLQFCRYAPLLAARGAKVILSVQKSLCTLLRRLDAAIEVHAEGERAPEFDRHSPLLSLPLAFGTTEATIPRDVPYLAADPEGVRRWRERLGSEGFKIGVSWQGSKLPIDVGRSFPLEALAAVADIPGVRLISLQKGAGCEQLAAVRPGMVEVLPDDFDAGPDAFLDTAAAMTQLDLVISSDTSIAHLAGALGRPAWVALQLVPEWRWRLEGESTAWYPTIRSFRQARRGDWQDVFRRMHDELTRRLRS
jgi:Flp pilus assembly protein TadD